MSEISPIKIKNILGVCFTLLGIAILIIGQVTPDIGGRLIYLGIPLNTVIFVATLLAIFVIDRGNSLTVTIFYLLPLLLGTLGLMNSENIEDGVYKYTNLIVSSTLTISCFYYAIKHANIKIFLKTFTIFFVMLLIATLIYKATHGFLNRDILFLLNGPIIFSRLMGGALLISLYTYSGKKRIILVAMFFLAMIWTSSKGPLVALALTFLMIFLFKFNLKNKIKYSFVILISATLIYINLSSLQNTPILDRYFLILEGFSSSVNTSYTSRSYIMLHSLNNMFSYPLGVGLGDWSTVIEGFGLTYPHNLFLEVFIELGWIIAPLFLVPYFYFFLKTNSIFFDISLFYFIAQQVSGDILDSRYIIVFSVLSLLSHKHAKKP